MGVFMGPSSIIGTFQVFVNRIVLRLEYVVMTPILSKERLFYIILTAYDSEASQFSFIFNRRSFEIGKEEKSESAEALSRFSSTN